MYQSYYPWIRSIAFRMVGANDFQDIAQDAFMKAWRARKTFQFNSDPKTWIYRIAINCVLDFLRKKKRDESRLSSDDINSVAASNSNINTEKTIQSALLQIPLDDRLLVVLHYFEGLSVKEISLVLKIATGTVKSRLFSAREKLKLILQDTEGDKAYGF